VNEVLFMCPSYFDQDESGNIDFIEIGLVSELENGGRLFVEVDEQAIVVFNIAGELFAIADQCSHDNGPLGEGDVEEYEVVCPRHGAKFDIRTGKALSLPAIVDIPTYPVRVIQGKIELGFPEE
jgi:3-phenylpropionate/trans-cinnamate dioxygenase ferredoxin subunit